MNTLSIYSQYMFLAGAFHKANLNLEITVFNYKFCFLHTVY